MSNKFILIIGPSGVGKGTLLNMLKNRHPQIFYPVSITTRPKRLGENDGETYYFFSKTEFENKIAANEFLEYAFVHNSYYYGTLKQPIIEALHKGKNVLREIDYQGFLSVQKLIPSNHLKSIFLLPPSTEILKARIKARAAISEIELANRMLSIEKELKIANMCDIQIKTINGDIEGTYKLLEEAIFN